MKLANMAVDRSQAVDTLLVMESLLTRMQSWLETDKELLANNPRLQFVLDYAKRCSTSLLQDNEETREWWNLLFDEWGVVEDHRDKVLRLLQNEISPRMSKPTQQTPNLKAALSGRGASNKQTNNQGEQIHERIESNHRLLQEAGFGQFVSNAIDWLDPNKRQAMQAKTALAADNARIAILAINFLRKEYSASPHPIAKDAEVVDTKKPGTSQQKPQQKPKTRREVIISLAQELIRFYNEGDKSGAAHITGILRQFGYEPYIENNKLKLRQASSAAMKQKSIPGEVTNLSPLLPKQDTPRNKQEDEDEGQIRW